MHSNALRSRRDQWEGSTGREKSVAYAGANLPELAILLLLSIGRELFNSLDPFRAAAARATRRAAPAPRYARP